MTETMSLPPECLVLYKGRPALVKNQEGERLFIEIPPRENARSQGKPALETRKVRPKDVLLLHPGPLGSLSDIESSPPADDVETVAEILRGQSSNLQELSELVFGEYSPTTALAAWRLVDDGLYFEGSPDKIHARAAELVADDKAKREAREAAQRQLDELVERIAGGEKVSEESHLLLEVEDLACGRRQSCRLLRGLGRAESEENAHSLLLEIERWDRSRIPRLERSGLNLEAPLDLSPDLPAEERLDLTHLDSFAIDDEGSTDPDDAISLEGDRLWVHIADVAATISPESEADTEARARGTTVYLPDQRVPMLPDGFTKSLALGLAQVSPALSFGLDIGDDGEIRDLHIVPSTVAVRKITYAEAEVRREEAPFSGLRHLAALRREHRISRGAVSISLPDVSIVVDGGSSAGTEARPAIHPLPPFESREMVAEAMIAVGEAVGAYAAEQGIPFPFSTQAPAAQADDPVETDGLAGMFALRRRQPPSRTSVSPGTHAGLGLDVYSRATSPLRRYTDLLAHQQLRAHQAGLELLSETEVVERLGATEEVAATVRQTERLVRRHWTLVYFEQQPEWRGEATLVDRRGSRGTILIPELAFEGDVHLKEALTPLNSVLPLKLLSVNLPRLEAHFSVG